MFDTYVRGVSGIHVYLHIGSMTVFVMYIESVRMVLW